MVKIKVVFYVFLVPEKWEKIFTGQIERLKKLGLYDHATVYISASGEDKELEKLRSLIKRKYSKLVEKNFQYNNEFEYPGIKTVYDIAENDDDAFILYFHTKGIVSGQNRISDLLSAYTIDNYEHYIDQFQKDKQLDVCCVIPSVYGFAYFNYFWVRSSYVRNYCNKPVPDDCFMKNGRFTWEMWLGYYNGYSRKINVKTYSPFLKKFAVSDEVGAMEIVRNLDYFETNNLDPYSPEFLQKTDRQHVSRRKLSHISHGRSSIKISALTDKITHHSYLLVYDDLFSTIQDSVKNILEIGVWIGASLPLWRNYFTDAKIYAVDIHDKDFLTIEEIKNDCNITIHMPNDGYNPQFIYREFISKGILFDLIVDDGPHTLQSQIDCIERYVPLLSETGMLVIEDVASINYLQPLLNAVPEALRKHIRMYDLRQFKGKYDDILFIIDKNFDAGSAGREQRLQSQITNIVHNG